MRLLDHYWRYRQGIDFARYEVSGRDAAGLVQRNLRLLLPQLVTTPYAIPAGTKALRLGAMTSADEQGLRRGYVMRVDREIAFDAGIVKSPEGESTTQQDRLKTFQGRFVSEVSPNNLEISTLGWLQGHPAKRAVYGLGNLVTGGLSPDETGVGRALRVSSLDLERQLRANEKRLGLHEEALPYADASRGQIDAFFNAIYEVQPDIDPATLFVDFIKARH